MMYEKPEIEVVKLNAEDVIATSNTGTGTGSGSGQGGGVVLPDDPDGF